MKKDINELHLNDAKYIYKYQFGEINGLADEKVKEAVRKYLRMKKLTPLDCIVIIDKAKSSLPGLGKKF